MPGQVLPSRLGLVKNRGAPDHDAESRSSGSDLARNNAGMVGGDDGVPGWGQGRSMVDAASGVGAGGGSGGGEDGGCAGFGTSGSSSLSGSGSSSSSGRSALSTAAANRSPHGGDVGGNTDGGGGGGSGGKRSTLPTGAVPAPHAKRHRKSRTPSPNPTIHAGSLGSAGDILNTLHAGSNGGGDVMKWRGGANSVEGPYATAATQGGRTGAREGTSSGGGCSVDGSGGAEGSGSSWGGTGSAGGEYSNHGGWAGGWVCFFF